jgi:glycosyltransferase involved in cell wall biosynthesis
MQGNAPNSVLLLDISRLIWRAHRRAPTGIDRVELAYAQHFLEEESDRPAYGVVHLFGLVLSLSPAGARRFVRDLAARWRGSMPLTGWRRCVAVIKTYLHLVTSVWYVGPWLRRRLRSAPGPGFFLVVSHHHVSRDYTLSRIRRRLGVKMVCLVHDLIPIDYPEYFPPGWEERYERISSNIGRYFDGAIANSASTARSLKMSLDREPERTSSTPVIRVAPLGVRRLAAPQRALLELPQRPYFVVLGTIEPRKNHLLLLNVWTRLASTVPDAPQLIVIGARGWENEQVVDLLERSRRLRGLVREYNALGDAEVDSLLQHARALLLPSFAEGFGLPVAEALASGVPVICSDIPVFHELGGEVPEYLDPLDPQAWGETALEYARDGSAQRAAQLSRLARWRAPVWSDHFAAVERLLGDLDAGTDALSALPDSTESHASLGPSVAP